MAHLHERECKICGTLYDTTNEDEACPECGSHETKFSGGTPMHKRRLKA